MVTRAEMVYRNGTHPFKAFFMLYETSLPKPEVKLPRPEVEKYHDFQLPVSAKLIYSFCRAQKYLSNHMCIISVRHSYATLWRFKELAILLLFKNLENHKKS